MLKNTAQNNAQANCKALQIKRNAQANSSQANYYKATQCGENFFLSLSLSLSLVSFLFVIYFFNTLNLFARFCGLLWRLQRLAMTGWRKFTKFTQNSKKFTLRSQKIHKIFQKNSRLLLKTIKTTAHFTLQNTPKTQRIKL